MFSTATSGSIQSRLPPASYMPVFWQLVSAFLGCQASLNDWRAWALLPVMSNGWAPLTSPSNLSMPGSRAFNVSTTHGSMLFITALEPMSFCVEGGILGGSCVFGRFGSASSSPWPALFEGALTFGTAAPSAAFDVAFTITAEEPRTPERRNPIGCRATTAVT